MKISRPHLPEKKAESWQLKKLELAKSMADNLDSINRNLAEMNRRLEKIHQVLTELVMDES